MQLDPNGEDLYRQLACAVQELITDDNATHPKPRDLVIEDRQNRIRIVVELEVAVLWKLRLATPVARFVISRDLVAHLIQEIQIRSEKVAGDSPIHVVATCGMLSAVI